MRVVADLIRGGAGRRSLARRLGVPVSTAGKWVLSYRFGGEAALMGEREGNRRYDYETKLAAVRDHVEHGLTKAEVMEKYRIAGPAPLERWCREYRSGGPDALRPKPKGRPRARNPSRGRLPQGNSSLRRRTRTSRRGSRTWKKSTPCWRGDRQPGQNGDRLHAGGAGTSAPAPAQGGRTGEKHVLPSSVASGAVTRPDIEPMVAEIFARTPNGCGHRQIRMCLVHEFGVRVSHKSVLKVMRRMGLECRIRRPNPYRKYSSYRDETGARAENLLNRDFTADRPWVKLGTDVTEFRVADGKAYPAPVYDMGSKEIVAWDVSRHPDMAQQRRLLAMLEEKLPEDANPIPHSDMGWQYRHRWWRDRLAGLNIRQSMSRKGNCIDNAATEQVFGHLKDEFHAGREFASYEQFKNELDAYIIHWNTKRRQIRLEGHTPEEFRNMSPTA